MSENTGAPDTETAETIAEAAVHSAPTEYSKIPYVIELHSTEEESSERESLTEREETQPERPCPPSDPT